MSENVLVPWTVFDSCYPSNWNLLEYKSALCRPCLRYAQLRKWFTVQSAKKPRSLCRLKNMLTPYPCSPSCSKVEANKNQSSSIFVSIPIPLDTSVRTGNFESAQFQSIEFDFASTQNSIRSWFFNELRRLTYQESSWYLCCF